MYSSKEVRACFPSLKDGFAFLDNAGGSQVPAVVIDAIADYFRTKYAQTGGTYPASVAARETIEAAHAFVAQFMNAGQAGGVILGASSTTLVHGLANAFGEILHAGDEIIVSDANHEGNATPWRRLERFGIKVVAWPIDAVTLACEPDSLRALLTPRTRVVAFPHVSNLLGRVSDARAIADVARAAGAVSVCDGVAYAPHRAIDVQAFGCDFYFYSTYKVFGPHMGAMFGRREAWAPLTGANHGFIPRDAFPTKWEPGGVSHEGCAGVLALQWHVGFLEGEPYQNYVSVQRAFDHVADLERGPHARLLEYLTAKNGVSVLGPTQPGPDAVALVSFRHARVPSARIAAVVNRRGLGIKHGHFYSVRLLQALGIDPEDGVARVSLAHYNTVEEIGRLIAVLEEVFAG